MDNVQFDDSNRSYRTEHFIYLDTRKDPENAEQYDLMHLYECGTRPSAERLVSFCRECQASFSGQQDHYLVFFDNRNNAGFPSGALSSLYRDDAHYMPHIEAIYLFNLEDGKSVLHYFEGPPGSRSEREIII